MNLLAEIQKRRFGRLLQRNSNVARCKIACVCIRKPFLSAAAKTMSLLTFINVGKSLLPSFDRNYFVLIQIKIDAAAVML